MDLTPIDPLDQLGECQCPGGSTYRPVWSTRRHCDLCGLPVPEVEGRAEAARPTGCSGCPSLNIREGHHRFCRLEPDDMPSGYPGAGRSIPPAVAVPAWCRRSPSLTRD